MALKCFLLDLKDDPALIAEYREWHRPGGPPKAVLDALRAQGVNEMRIFLTGDRLCLVIEADEGFDADAKRAAESASPETVAWETKMWAYQRALPWAETGQKWVEAEEVFKLSEHP